MNKLIIVLGVSCLLLLNGCSRVGQSLQVNGEKVTIVSRPLSQIDTAYLVSNGMNCKPGSSIWHSDDMANNIPNGHNILLEKTAKLHKIGKAGCTTTSSKQQYAPANVPGTTEYNAQQKYLALKAARVKREASGNYTGFNTVKEQKADAERRKIDNDPRVIAARANERAAQANLDAARINQETTGTQQQEINYQLKKINKEFDRQKFNRSLYNLSTGRIGI